MKLVLITALALSMSGGSLQAATFTGTTELSNGSDDGDVRVSVDGLGRSRDAIFDPVGPIAPGDTFYDSRIYLRFADDIAPLAPDGDVTLISQDAHQLATRFQVGSLGFKLTQTVRDALQDGQQTGSLLNQSYSITNLSTQAQSFSLLRYLDGDLYLNDDTLADGGGVISRNDQLILFETDVSGDPTDDNTFVGITASGGTRPQTGAFEVAECCGVPLPLQDRVARDADGDLLTDEAYDVTMSMQRDFSLAPGETQIFQTLTLFGNAAPPPPGSTETIPLLPGEIGATSEGVPVFVFALPENYAPRQTIFIDPVVAAGYVYEVTGNTFYSVTAPSLAAVPDDDALYTLSVGGTDYVLGAGNTVVFSDLGLADVIRFTITGIALGLALDPANPLAFPTGVALVTASNDTRITQTPIVLDTTPSVIPLPASALLLGGALLGLGAVRRLRRRAA